jgi:cytochrome b pre-mRNA-processing protein 3
MRKEAFMRLFGLFSSSPQKLLAQELYHRTLAASRVPFLYARLGVPDTLNGRYDMLMLHAFLLIRRLQGEGVEGRELAQHLFDALFADMDDALRGIGVGDMGIGKRIRKMAEAFYGRAGAYEKALASGERAELQEALARNIWPDDNDPALQEQAAHLAAYVRRQWQNLTTQSMATLRAGAVSFLPSYTQTGDEPAGMLTEEQVRR